MSVSESGDVLSQTNTLRWIGYGLAGLGFAAFLARLAQPGALWTSVLLICAIAGLAAVFRAPEAFETTMRGGSRGLNPLVCIPAFLLFVIAMADQIDDLTLPVAGAAVGVAVFLMLSLRALGRPGLAGPITLQIISALAGAAIGYGAIVALDVDYDHAAPAVLSPPVLDKYVTYGRRSTNYHLRVAPFGARRAASSLNVSRSAYDAHSAGGVVCVLEHRGALGLSWAQLCSR